MTEPVDWTDGRAPRSARYGDVYRSASSGLAQAHLAFLSGCGLPQGWAQQPRWCILETGFGLGLNFLAAWQAWRADPQRPRMLHFASVEAHPVAAADLLRSAQAHPELVPLAEQLAAQWWGLHEGWHRLAFEGGEVLLTLGIGDACTRLREQSFIADSVFLDGFDPRRNPRVWDTDTLSAVARLCRSGTTLGTWCVATAVRHTLQQLGFAVERVPGLAPKRQHLRARMDARHPAPASARPPAQAIVVGGGIAGASAAAALARRGWQVQVLDAAPDPAAGASGLPAGLFAPHVSPDDAPLSRLSRAGVRATRLSLMQHLPDAEGFAWCASGVLERPIERVRQLPPAAEAALHAYSRPASGDDCAQLNTPHLKTPEDAALWHGAGGWLQPPALVRALLQTPGVQWRGGLRVHALQPTGPRWQAMDEAGQTLAEADLVVLAAARGTQALCAPVATATASALPLQPLGGQVTVGMIGSFDRPGTPPHTDAAASWPRVPVNGHGSLIAGLRLPGVADGQPAWIVGSTFERGRDEAMVTPSGHDSNLQRLHALAPGWAPHTGRLWGWAGVRATLPDRLPAVGALGAVGALEGDAASPWVMTGFGSRGMTLAPLAAELLCAWLHAEPLPVDAPLAQRLRASRFTARSQPG